MSYCLTLDCHFSNLVILIVVIDGGEKHTRKKKKLVTKKVTKKELVRYHGAIVNDFLTSV